MPKSPHLGKNLRQIRIFCEVKQDTLARALGITQQAVSKIEQKQNITEPLLLKIAGILKVNPDVIKKLDRDKILAGINAFYNPSMENMQCPAQLF